MDFGQKNFFREIDLFDFTSFFGLDFFKFSGPGHCEVTTFYTEMQDEKNCFAGFFQ